MKCNIEYVGKMRCGKTKYYCTVHKSYAYDKMGNKLEECWFPHKEVFDNCLDIKENNIKDIKIIYSNILESTMPEIVIDGEYFNGVLKCDDSILTYKDFGGLMLAKLNNINLESVKCNHCGRYHTDNGEFAYTPHKIHLCTYCGHLFHAKAKNVGSEFLKIFNIPDIKLKDKLIEVNDKITIEYDMLKGKFLINNQNGNKVLLDGKEISIVELLNNTLKDEY